MVIRQSIYIIVGTINLGYSNSLVGTKSDGTTTTICSFPSGGGTLTADYDISQYTSISISAPESGRFLGSFSLADKEASVESSWKANASICLVKLNTWTSSVSMPTNGYKTIHLYNCWNNQSRI